MNKHKHESSLPLLSSTNSPAFIQSLKQYKITCFTSNSPRSIKFTEYEKTKIKDLLVDWVCTDIRPFSIVNDNGLRSLVQEYISLCISFFLHNHSFINFFTMFL